MEHQKNTTADDISAVIGYTPTSALCAWFGGEQLYVPVQPDAAHPIIGLIGKSAFERLCQAFGGERLCIPLGFNEENRRNLRIAKLMNQGKSTGDIARLTGLTPRRVDQLKRHIELIGIRKILGKNARIKPPEESTADVAE